MLNERLLQMVNERLIHAYKILWEELPELPQSEIDSMFSVLSDLKELMLRLDNTHRRYILKVQTITILEPQV